MIRFTTLLTTFLLSCASLFAQTALIQIVHNAPQPTIDLYIDSILRYDNMVFRTATPYVSVPAGKPVVFSVGGDATLSINDAFLHFNAVFEAGKTYTVFADGVIFANPPFDMLSAPAEQTSGDPRQVRISLHHGVPGAAPVDVSLFEVRNLYGNVSYGNFTGYATVDTGVYYFIVKEAGTAKDLDAPAYYADMRAWGGKAVRLFTSGYVNGDPAFRLMAALPDGTVVVLPATTTPPVNARVQIIHNAPSDAVDIYANGTLLVNDLDYRKATSFLDVYKGSYTLSVAPANSTSSAQAFATVPFEAVAGNTVVIMATGARNSSTDPFRLVVNQQGKEAADFPFGVDASVWHGSSDAPAIDADLVFLMDNAVKNLKYQQFSPYLTLGPEKYDLALRRSDSLRVLLSYRLDMTAWSGKAVQVFASGRLSGVPAFGLFAALPDGTVVALAKTPLAKVQVVHNTIDPTIDLYTGNNKWIDDLEFRKATPYLNIPADRPVPFGIAGAGSNSPFEVLFKFNRRFGTDSLYTVFLNGIAFDTVHPVVMTSDLAQTASPHPAKVSFSVFHGIPGNAPVRISVLGGGYSYNNLAYNRFTPFSETDPATYYFQVSPQGPAGAMITYEVKLDTLAGRSFRLFLSGRVSGAPATGLFGVFADGRVVEFPVSVATPQARVQFIHNSPGPAMDVYWDNTLQIDNLDFRKATPFLNIPAGRNIVIGIAPAGSSDPSQANLTFTLRFSENKNYILTASGLASGNPPLALLVREEARITSSASNTVAVTVLHGAVGAPAVDVDALLDRDNLITNLNYGRYSDYIELTPDLYDFALRSAGTSTVLANFRADVSALAGQAVSVFASGTPGGSPAFGLYAVLTNGTVIPLATTPLARVQFLHNAASTTIDLYANRRLLIDNFRYRKGTPFLTLPAGRNIVVNIAPETSTMPTQGLVTFQLNLEQGKRYIAAAIGRLGGSPGFDIVLNQTARENSTVPASIALTTLHGVPDAPALDADALLVANSMVTGLGYAQFAPYATLDAGIQDIAVRVAGATDVLGTFRADFTNDSGQAYCLFASGVLTGSPALGLFALAADGSVIELTPTPFARVQFIHSAQSSVVDIYSGRVLWVDDMQFRQATPFRSVPANRSFTMGIAGMNSQASTESMAQFQVNFAAGRRYHLVAAGLISVTPNLQLFINDQARETATNPANFEVAAFNGSFTATDLHITPYQNGLLGFDPLSFGQYAPYRSVPPGAHYLTVKLGGMVAENVVAEGKAGQAGLIFGTVLRGFEIEYRTWMALPDGTTYPLPIFTGTQDLSHALKSIQLMPNPASDQLFVQTDFKTAQQQVRFLVRDISGRVLLHSDRERLDAGAHTETLPVGDLLNGFYFLEIRSGEGTLTRKFAVQR